MFHVGGFTTSMAKDAVPRWEIFIADRPHAEGLDAHGRRQPFDQIAQAEALAMPGDVIVSQEVAEVSSMPLYLSAERRPLVAECRIEGRLRCICLMVHGRWDSLEYR